VPTENTKLKFEMPLMGKIPLSVIFSNEVNKNNLPNGTTKHIKNLKIISTRLKIALSLPLR
jgi:hypothetical protein